MIMVCVECTDSHQQPGVARDPATLHIFRRKSRNQGHTNSSQQSVLFHHRNQHSCSTRISSNMITYDNVSMARPANRPANSILQSLSVTWQLAQYWTCERGYCHEEAALYGSLYRDVSPKQRNRIARSLMPNRDH